MPSRSALARAGLGLVLFMVAACSDDDSASRDESGAIEEEGNVGAFDIEVGDCFDDPEDLDLGTQQTVVDLAAVPCDEPHDNEAYFKFELAGEDDAFPGEDAVTEQGSERCLEEFEPFVGIDYESSELDADPYLRPTAESWEQGDREIVCVVYNADLSPMTGSAKGSAE